MLNIAIIDSDAESVARVKRIVTESFSKLQEAVCFTVFYNPLDFLTDYRSAFDLVITEIDLPHLNGIETIARLRKVDVNVCVVFFTAQEQYAIEGYKVNASHFLLKNYTDEKLSEQFASLCARIVESKSVESLVVVQEGVYHKFAIRSLKYVEVNSHRLSYHTSNKTFVVRGNLNEVAQQLAKYNFIKIHKSYIVNIREILSIDKKSVTVSGGTELPLSRNLRNDVLEIMSQFTNGKLG